MDKMSDISRLKGFTLAMNERIIEGENERRSRAANPNGPSAPSEEVSQQC